MKSKVHTKIALFTASLSVGGAERVIVTLANELYRRGYAVEVVLVRRFGALKKELLDGVRVIDLGSSRTLFSLLPLIRYLYKANPNVLLATLNHINIIAVFARLLYRKPLSFFIREANTVSKSMNNYSNFMAHIIGALTRITYSFADRVLAPSQGVANDLIKYYKISAKQIFVIPNPIDFDLINTLALEEPTFKVIMDRNIPIVIGVGRLTPQKDFTTLIRAFSLVVESIDSHLIILGEGVEREYLLGLAKSLNLEDHVSMPGLVENPFAIMKTSSLYVLSSRWEGLPNTLLQSLALGLPVVATDCPSGPREILQGGRFGRLVPVGDIEAMAHAIVFGLRGYIKKPPYELIKQRYSVSSNVSQYLSVFFRNNMP